MRKIIGSVAVILAAALAGCAPTSNGPIMQKVSENPSEFTVLTNTLSDGVTLECAYIKDVNGRSGFDCNWEGVTVEREGYSE